MEVRSLAVRRLALVLIAGLCALFPIVGQAQTARARIALFEPCGQNADATLTAALCTVADSVELSLACLQRYEVRRLPAVDPTSELDKVRAYCQANRIDQAIAGSGSARSAGGYAFRLVVYDRRSDSITLVREGASTGALDMFDATDALVAALLDGLSGEHLLFGSLVIETDPPGAAVSVNGTEVGPAPLSLRGLPVGTVMVTAQSSGRETAETQVAILDGETASASLQLARSMGALTLNMPEDASVVIRGTDLGEKTIQGSEPQQLPTGTYEVQANCTGLDAASQTIEIQRNETFRWMPWPKGYLNVQSDPPAATVVVDGTERGFAPLIVEVDPGVLHRVELRKDKYELYRADLNAVAARKVTFQPVMVAKPGSIHVETTPSGATVRLDHRKILTTPCTFDAVQPGPHTIVIDDVLIDRRYYDAGPAVVVAVNPDEQTDVARTLEPGTGHLEITDVPPSGVVTVNGAIWTPGEEVPAGMLDIAIVKSPSGMVQTWKKTVRLFPGTTGRWSRDSLVPSVPRAAKGKGHDWAGLEPLWKLPGTDRLQGQPGTALKEAFLCRDDRFLYVKMIFADGTPLRGLTKSIVGPLIYELHCRINGATSLMMNISSDRQGGTGGWVGIWDGLTGTGKTISQSLSFTVGDSTLEYSVPWTIVEQYLAAGPIAAGFSVKDSTGAYWNSGYTSPQVQINFVD